MLEFAPRSAQLMAYGDALLYCTFCNHGGYNDWRMATKLEWIAYHINWGWYIDRPPLHPTTHLSVTPVRNVK